MKLYDIPLLNGYKSAIAGYGLILVALGELLVLGGSLVSGNMEIGEFATLIQPGMTKLFAGLGVIGVRHAIDKK